MVNQEYSAQLNPACLDSPPEANFPRPPVKTRIQTLPFRELSWENFERLILRIARREANVSECWAYGDRGQKQYGLDILAELPNASGKFACYQCKRVDKFSSGDIQKAVAKFLEGKWASKTRKFVLCTSLQLTETKQVEEISRQRDVLGNKGIEFDTWDASAGGQLCERLKKYPDLVDDFFLREWVRLFNGEDAASSLGEKLDGEKLADLRFQLKQIYSTLFLRSDPGIRLGSGHAASLLYRYVSPAVIETREVARIEGTSAGTTEALKGEYYSEEQYQRIQSRTSRPRIQEIRVPIGDWLSRNKRAVILGEPGFGKSALLHVVVLQLLEGLDKPCSLPWHGLLPVWISFGGFSAAVQRQDDISIEDYFEQWLHKHGADPIRPLFQRAVRYGEILLLIDGLDEGQNIYAARQAMDRVSTFLSIRPVPAVFTSRPRGYTQVRPDGTWPLARLSSFDEAQIECFAGNWFKHFETETSAEERCAWPDFATEQRKEEFLKAVRANPRVMDLARIPLFCQLLTQISQVSSL